jgi:hypothetical protein
MKHLVSEYHALNIIELARGDWLDQFSQYDWVWRTNKGTREASVNITVLKDSLQLLFPMGGQRAQQGVRLTFSIGRQGGKRPWFVCLTCRSVIMTTGRPDVSRVRVWPASGLEI